MTVYLKCIYENNFGDDLFVDILCRRYPKVNFVVVTMNKVNRIKNINNLKVIYIPRFLYKIIRRVSFMLDRICIIDRVIISKCDYVVSIGGSIFMENRKQINAKNRKKLANTDWYRRLGDKRYYILGANIGPTYTKDYLKWVYEVIEKSEDTCLRDRKSLELVSKSKARIAPDIVFSIKTNEAKTPNKTVVFSLIDYNKKQEQIRGGCPSRYLEEMKKLAQKFRDSGYKVVFLSFCKQEGDLIASSSISNLANGDSCESYDGDLNETMKIISNATYIVGSRFHANIVGFAMGKRVIPIIYNDKTRNLLNDLRFKGRYIDIENNIYPDSEELLNNKPLPKKQIVQLRKDSEHHFDALDKVLNSYKYDTRETTS